MDNLHIEKQSEAIFIAGSLTVTTVEEALNKVKPLIAYDDNVKLNMQNVTEADSSSLALLMGILREAKLKRSNIIFLELPQQILDLSRVSGIEGLLTLEK